MSLAAISVPVTSRVSGLMIASMFRLDSDADIRYRKSRLRL